MYAKDKMILDRREQLRVKLKSLAYEAKCIRREERRTFGVLREELYRHRMDVVRHEARHTHLAYGLIRGLTIEQMEPTSHSKPDMEKVGKMVKKYGAQTVVEPLKKAA